MQKTLVFEVPKSIINKIMAKDEDFKMEVKINICKGQRLEAFANFTLLGQKNNNCITFILDANNDYFLKDLANKYLENGDYDVVFYYDLLHKASEGSSQSKKNSFFIKKDKNFYFVKIDAEGKQVFSEEFKNEDEFRNYTKVLNLKDDLKKIHKIITALVVLSIILVAVMFVTLGLFTGGVAPAILTPLIAKCLMGVFGGIGVLGFSAFFPVYFKGKTLEKSIKLAQDDIDILQNEINDLGEKDSELNDNEKNNNGFEIPKGEGENENDHENEYGS